MNKTTTNGSQEIMVTRIRTNHGRWGRPIAMSMECVADVMRSDRYAATVKSRDRLPYLIFSGLFSHRGVHELVQPTGLMLLSTEAEGDSQQRALLRKSVEQLPQTLMAFTDGGRRTLYIVARCESADGTLPTEPTAYLRFLKQAQQQASRYYEAMCGCRIPLVEETLTRGCRLECDSEAYYNAEATAVTVVSGAGRLRADYPLAQTDRWGNTVSEPSWRDIERERADFYACYDKAWDQAAPAEDADEGADPVAVERFVACLARLCRRSGLPEESSVRRTGCLDRWHMDEDAVRKVFRAVYRRCAEGRPWSQMSDKERVARKVKDFFERRYELRFNVMKQIEEFRPRGLDYHPWRPLTERDANRIAQEQMLDAGAAWPVDVKQYAQSSVTKDYNPLHEFLAGCGPWDGRRDYIGQLARRVPNDNPQWQQLFHRWFLGMVAQWLGMSRDYGNAVVPMLIGRQGCRKSTFCKMIIPRSLREYYIDDIKLDSGEQAERVLCRMALVNIDEYNAKTDREQAKIKRLLTERDVQVRRMRSDQYTMLPRTASFIATTNERQPLNDPTGSRRYLCVEVGGTIDTETPVNYQQLYAQALHELEQGEPYYMSPAEEQAMEQYNSRFQNASTTELLLEAYYRPATRSKQHFMRAADILADLQQRARGSDRPNMKQLVRALKAARYEYGAVNGLRGWYVEKNERKR